MSTQNPRENSFDCDIHWGFPPPLVGLYSCLGGGNSNDKLCGSERERAPQSTKFSFPAEKSSQPRKFVNCGNLRISFVVRVKEWKYTIMAVTLITFYLSLCVNLYVCIFPAFWLKSRLLWLGLLWIIIRSIMTSVWRYFFSFFNFLC